MSQEPVIVRRLNSHSEALGHLQRDLAIVTETLGLRRLSQEELADRAVLNRNYVE